MDAVRTNADFRFFMQWPFGVLMGFQTLFSLISLIVFYFALFLYEGTSFVIFMLSLLLVCSITHNIIHVFGLHRRVFVIFGRAVFIPATLLVFLTSAVCCIGMAISTLIVLIGFIDSLRFRARLIVVYAILTVTCAILTFACTKIVMLLFRAAPNGQIKGLVQVVIEGDRTSKITAAHTTTTTTTRTTTTTTTNFV
ncbi:hypothetical protein GCK72_005449 [Caenorhabditis remanei]|uniref:MARVEL domain-containing protein n=1 Tax=Caenorhabditis remanei TaxID=31234 RepID=A0A6A5HEF3_CAERE|nr:hypothetical protein GCK72_005449 [Caenorhabditis remanei]KAF1765497.1 hypothetical protein GCK72_005449 [Caenorhabditis remanei]